MDEHAAPSVGPWTRALELIEVALELPHVLGGELSLDLSNDAVRKEVGAIAWADRHLWDRG